MTAENKVLKVTSKHLKYDFRYGKFFNLYFFLSPRQHSQNSYFHSPSTQYSDSGFTIENETMIEDWVVSLCEKYKSVSEAYLIMYKNKTQEDFGNADSSYRHYSRGIRSRTTCFHKAISLRNSKNLIIRFLFLWTALMHRHAPPKQIKVFLAKVEFQQRQTLLRLLKCTFLVEVANSSRISISVISCNRSGFSSSDWEIAP